MNIQHQNWKPDTCDCLVEEQYDRDDPNAVMTCSKVITKCPAHTNIADNNLYDVLYAAPTGENKRKNQFLSQLLAFSTLTTSDDSGNIVLKKGVVSWSFDANRVLHVTTTPSLTTNQKNTVQNWANTNFGSGFVVIG